MTSELRLSSAGSIPPESQPFDLRILGVLAACLAVATALWIAKPIANGHAYQLGFRVTAIAAFIWYASRFKQHWLDEPKFRWFIFLGSFYFVVHRPLTIHPNSEILAAYASAFQVLDRGGNPYDCGEIVHFAEHGVRKLGNFNYPPLELWPYYGMARLLGQWNHVVLALTLFALQLGACGLLFVSFPRAGLLRIGAFVPFLTCFELYTNVALSLLFVALVVLVLVRKQVAQRAWQRPALWVLFGSGLMTKFLVIPLFATYLWVNLDLRKPRSWLDTAVDLFVPLLIAVAWMAPFGVADVFRETVLFNLVLRERAVLTTFYPNVLSGGLTWLGVPEMFSTMAVFLLGGAIVATKSLPPLRAFTVATIAFLLVSPTPEPQYIPVLAYLALASVMQERGLHCAALARVRERRALRS